MPFTPNLKLTVQISLREISLNQQNSSRITKQLTKEIFAPFHFQIEVDVMRLRKFVAL